MTTKEYLNLINKVDESGKYTAEAQDRWGKTNAYKEHTKKQKTTPLTNGIVLQMI